MAAELDLNEIEVCIQGNYAGTLRLGHPVVGDLVGLVAEVRRLRIALKRIPELERRIEHLDAEAQREAIVAGQLLERAERAEAAMQPRRGQCGT